MQSSKLCSDRLFAAQTTILCTDFSKKEISSKKLSDLCNERLGWSKTTTYTVIKRLSERGVLKNEDATVTSLVSREEAEGAEIEALVQSRFDGSLPAFIAAFSRKKHLTEEQAAEILAMIDEREEE